MTRSTPSRSLIEGISKNLSHHKNELKLIAPIAIALLCYTSIRATLLSFAYDESISYYIINFTGSYWGMANNHPLNTLFMAISSRIFGESELSLRLPNVLAHVLYILFSFLVLCRLKNKMIAACGFLLLNTNPFMLDFFSLARGYGLSLTFLMGSIFFLFRSEQPGDTQDYRPVFIFSSLAVFSNYVLLNYHFAVLAILGIRELIRYRGMSPADSNALLRKHGSSLKIGIVTLVATTIILYHLKRGGCLCFGGNNGFWDDTVHSLLQCSMYFKDYGQQAISIAKIFILVAMCITGVGALVYVLLGKKLAASSLMMFITMLCAAICVAQFYLFGARFPMERTALYFIPLFVLSIVFFADDFTEMFPRTGRMTVIPVLMLVAILACLHFGGTANLTKTYTWYHDANTKDMLRQLHREYDSHTNMDKPRNIDLGVEWTLEPTVNYYRLSRKLTWLNPVASERVFKRPDGYDYYYVQNSDKDRLMKGRTLPAIETFLPAETVLIKGH